MDSTFPGMLDMLSIPGTSGPGTASFKVSGVMEMDSKVETSVTEKHVMNKQQSIPLSQ